jgi:hypothetical protein
MKGLLKKMGLPVTGQQVLTDIGPRPLLLGFSAGSPCSTF